MAEKVLFKTNMTQELINYTYYGGFALCQKRKCIDSLHRSIHDKYPGIKVLEISSKSNEPLGQLLSAFSLHKGDYSVENIYQSSKVFEYRGPFPDLLSVTPGKAKTDERLKESGRLIGYFYENEFWPAGSMFYDYLYINALTENKDLADGLMDYEGFTDIMFNQKTSTNCQAKAAAMYVYYKNLGLSEHALKNPKLYRKK